MRTVLPALLLACAGLVGCSGNDDAGAGQEGQDEGGAAPVFVKPSKKLLVDDKGKRSDVTLNECAALEPSGRTASGLAANNGKEATTYRVTVYFESTEIKPRPISWATTTVRVPAGEVVPWVAEKAFPYDGDLNCTLRAVG